MKVRKTFLLGLLLAGFGFASAVSFSAPTEVEAESVVTHDFASEWGAEMNAKCDCNGIGTNWYVEALNSKEFFNKAGQGASAHDANGKLETWNGWRNPQDYCLSTYPVWTNSTMVEGGVRHYNQYPLGWRMRDASDPQNYDNGWPEDHTKCSGSTLYFNVYCNGRVHPGTGVCPVLYYVAHQTGTAYVTDTVSVADSGSDGINLVIYKINKAEFVTSVNAWSGNTVHGLFNATPVFPKAGVNPTTWDSEGFMHVAGGASKSYVTEGIDLVEGDVLAFVYGEGNNNACDMTSTSPKIVFGEKASVAAAKKIIANTTQQNALRFTYDYDGSTYSNFGNMKILAKVDVATDNAIYTGTDVTTGIFVCNSANLYSYEDGYAPTMNTGKESKIFDVNTGRAKSYIYALNIDCSNLTNNGLFGYYFIPYAKAEGKYFYNDAAIRVNSVGDLATAYGSSSDATTAALGIAIQALILGM